MIKRQNTVWNSEVELHAFPGGWFILPDFTRCRPQPEPGYWAVRLGGKNTPEVGAAIIRRLHRPPDPASPTNVQGECNVLEGYLNGRLTLLAVVWLRTFQGRPIDESEYRFLVADRAWARAYRPRLPEANPYERVDLRTAPPALPTRRS